MPPIRRNTRSTASNAPTRRPKIAGSSVRPTPDATSVTPADAVPASVGATVAVAPEAATTVATVATAPEVAEVAAAPEVTAAPSGARGRSGWAMVAALGAVAALLAAFAVIAAMRPGAQVSNTAYVDIATTSEVTEATRSVLETLYAYAPDSIDQYPEKARGVLTETMRGEFDQTVDPTVSAVKQSGTSTTVQLSDIGVKVLDGDRAELIVNMTVSAEMNGVAQDSASGPLIVRMEKVDGVWLLSDIADQ